MTPGELQPASFAAYPEQARALAVRHLDLLRAMPLSLLPSYLEQLQQFPTLFPIEQARLAAQLDALARQREQMAAFRAIVVPPPLSELDWLHDPARFLSAFAGALWQTRQIDAFHTAAATLYASLPQAAPETAAAAPLLLVVFGRGGDPARYPPFSRLRDSGLHVRTVGDAGAGEALCRIAASRAAADPEPYRHWYVDGGSPWPLAGASAVHGIDFPAVAPLTAAVLREMNRAVQEGTGPEVLATRLREAAPELLRIPSGANDVRVTRLLVSLLVEGSGTQLYSTSFVQAAALELVRRAQPSTLLLRFAPRRKPASMNDMLEQRGESVATDPQGSLVDADMALYYTALAMRKMPGGDRMSLLAYVEQQGQLFLFGPRVVRGAESTTPMTMERALAML